MRPNHSTSQARQHPLFFCLLVAVLGMGVAGGAGVPPVWTVQSGGQFYSVQPRSEASAPAGFTRLSPNATGIGFTNLLAAEKGLTNRVYMNGSGVALGDVDGDGWCDVYLCGLDNPNALFRNLGNWKFEDITKVAGVDCANLDATSAAFVDIDGDRDLDLIVNSMGGGTRCFLNDGHGKFTDVSQSCGLDSFKSRSSMAIADFDGDGLLDLYLCAYRRQALMDMPQTYFEFRTVQGQRVIESINRRPVTDPEFTNRFVLLPDGNIEEYGEGGDLYRNKGGGRFELIPFTGGTFLDANGAPLTSRPFDWELAAMFRDLNGDGAPDLYVCNDFFTPDRLWLNDGKGHFRLAPENTLHKTSHFSMGVDVADINRDGLDDIFVLDMFPKILSERLVQLPERSQLAPLTAAQRARLQVPRNTLQLNRGDGTYAEIAQLAGLDAADWAWCPLFLDVDLDGYEDLLITNGNLQDSRNMDWVNTLARMRVEQKLDAQGIFESRKILPPLRTPNLSFRNRGDLTFEDMGDRWGFHDISVSHGMATADLDNDGDLDVVVNNLNEGCFVYRNNTTAPRVAVRLQGKSANTHGIGARIRVQGGAVSSQQQEIVCGGRYASSDDPIRTFAAGSLTNRLSIEVRWRDGSYSTLDKVQPNRVYEISQTTSSPGSVSSRTSPTPTSPSPLFEDQSSKLQHKHTDEPFDDYARQPLLPWRLGNLGPGIVCADLNNDGTLDLAVGSGRRGQTRVWWGDGNGTLTAASDLSSLLSASRDQTALLSWPRSTEERLLIIGLSSYEDGLSVGAAVKGYDLQAKKVVDLVPGSSSSTGPLALADVDGDGDLDLFVGGRMIPGRYPEPATSRLFLAGAGRFQLDTNNAVVLTRIGLVTDAVFSDLDQDGDPDLILACEWNSLKVLRNDGGRLTDVTAAWGLDQYRGWWNGISTGDFNEDGLPDIVASNAGRNTPYEAYRSHPILLVYGDVAGNSAVDLIEAAFVPERNGYAALRQLDLLSRQFPFLREHIPNHRAFADATIVSAFGERLNSTTNVSVNWLESTLFINRTGRFSVHPLPAPAQFSSGWAVAVADINGDGHEDLLMSQNNFGQALDRPRLDAGQGLVLLGDGQANLQPLSSMESGVNTTGEGRGLAVGDFDGDGRADLIVSQNSGTTHWYHNTTAVPGVQVRLLGTAENPDAIGATLRLGTDTQPGPARELHSGGGYWSANSPWPVLATGNQERTLEVRWPGGKITRSKVTTGARRITVSMDGTVQVLK